MDFLTLYSRKDWRKKYRKCAKYNYCEVKLSLAFKTHRWSENSKSTVYYGSRCLRDVKAEGQVVWSEFFSIQSPVGGLGDLYVKVVVVVVVCVCVCV